MSSLTNLGSSLATCGGLSYLVSLYFWAWWVVSNTNQFYLWGKHYLCTLLSIIINGRIHSNIHLFIHVIQSLFFSLFFLCMLVRILSSKIYFLFFFLASLHIALIYYFYMVSELQGWSIISTELRSASSLLSLSEEELQDFLLVCFAGCRYFILGHINSAIWILHQL